MAGRLASRPDVSAASGGAASDTLLHRRSALPTRIPPAHAPPRSRRYPRRRRSHRAACPSDAGVAFRVPGPPGRMRTVLQGRTSATHRCVQVPWRVQRGVLARRRHRRTRRGDAIVRQPRRRGGAGVPDPRNIRYRRGAAFGSEDQTRRHPRFRRAGGAVRSAAGRSQSRDGAGAGADRWRTRASVRRRARDRGTGHRHARTAAPHAGPRRAGGARFRWRAVVGHGACRQGAAAGDRDHRGRARGRARRTRFARAAPPHHRPAHRHHLRRPACAPERTHLRYSFRALQRHRARKRIRDRGRDAADLGAPQAGRGAVRSGDAGCHPARTRALPRQARGRDPERRQRRSRRAAMVPNHRSAGRR